MLTSAAVQAAAFHINVLCFCLRLHICGTFFYALKMQLQHELNQ